MIAKKLTLLAMEKNFKLKKLIKFQKTLENINSCMSLREAQAINALQKQLFNQIAEFFETSPYEEVLSYKKYFSERALIGSLASQIKKLIQEIEDLDSSIKDIDTIIDRQKDNLSLNFLDSRDDLEATGVIDRLEQENKDLLKFLKSSKVQQVIEEVDNNTTLFGNRRDDDFGLTSNDFMANKFKEGILDDIKNIGSSIKQKANDVKKDLKSYTTKNNFNKSTAINRGKTAQAVFGELGTKIEDWSKIANEAKDFISKSGSSSFEKLARNLGRTATTLGGVVKLAGGLLPPLGAAGNTLQAVGSLASMVGNVRKNWNTGHKLSLAGNVLGGAGASMMGVNSIANKIGKTSSLINKIGAAGKTLTGAKTVTNGVNQVKNSKTTTGKVLGAASALGGLYTMKNGINQFTNSSNISDKIPDFKNQRGLEDEDDFLPEDSNLTVSNEFNSIEDDFSLEDDIENFDTNDLKNNNFSHFLRNLNSQEEDTFIDEEKPFKMGMGKDLNGPFTNDFSIKVDNTNSAIANAKPGDYIIRNDGTKIILKGADIKYAQAAIGKISPKTNPFDPTNPQVGQITSKGHMITDKDIALLKNTANNKALSQQAVNQIKNIPASSPIAPLPQEAIQTGENHPEIKPVQVNNTALLRGDTSISSIQPQYNDEKIINDYIQKAGFKWNPYTKMYVSKDGAIISPETVKNSAYADLEKTKKLQNLSKKDLKAYNKYNNTGKISKKRYDNLVNQGVLKRESISIKESKDMSTNTKSIRTAAQVVKSFATRASKIAGDNLYEKLYYIGEKFFMEASLADDQSYLYQDIISEIESIPNFRKDSEDAVRIADIFIEEVNKA